MPGDAPDYWLRGLRIDLVNLVNRIALIDEITRVALITAITNIGNLTSVDLIDLIDKITEITTIKKIEVVEGSVDPYGLSSKTKVLDQLAFTYDSSGNIETVKGYEGASQKYTLTFTWTSGALTNIVRT